MQTIGSVKFKHIMNDMDYPSRIINAGDIVRHFKGNLYQILAIAKHSETREDMVVYTSLYGESRDVWVRPYEMFMEPVDLEKYPNADQGFRFEKVEISKI